MSNDEKFNYSYTAPNEKERREIESIKKQYVTVPEKENKLEQLRNLNKKVTRLPMMISLAIGIIGTLILGVGMTMVLEWHVMVWGVIVGIVGVVIAAISYPIYRALLNRNKKKYGQQIIDLSNELLNEKGNDN